MARLAQNRYKYLVLLFMSCFLFAVNNAFARHIKGGWIGYKYVSSTSSSTTYKVTVTLYVNCVETGPTDKVILGIFDGGSKSAKRYVTINNTAYTNMTKTSFNPCMTNPPSICYKIYTYVSNITLDNNTNGYYLAVQDAYRMSGIANITNSSSTGITIVGTIPGTINGVGYQKNSSPDFVFQDTTVVCYKSTMNIPFSATDDDGDSISYAFTNALGVNNASQNTSSSNPAAPNYPVIAYSSGYSGQNPMGTGVSIDPKTGLITGKAPSTTGEYVVAVNAYEWRNGVLIDSVKKELQILVNDCSLSAAELDPSYTNCTDYSLTFMNENSASISTYLWNFGDSNSGDQNISTSAQPTHVYSDTGTFTLSLSVTNAAGCQDSTKSTIKVYPGFKADFEQEGTCYQNAINFIDKSYVKYGKISTWQWSFGDGNSSTNSAPVAHLFASPGTYATKLYIESDKGCTDQVTKEIVVNDKPSLKLDYTDTLICSIDSLQLKASTDASEFQWLPSSGNIINANTLTPTVFPTDTTAYTIIASDKGCVDTAYVTVNVLKYIDVKISDTFACIGDSVTLHPESHALSYLWSQTEGSDALNNTTLKYPSLLVTGKNSYHVDANLGKCSSSANVIINAAPYPKVNSHIDTTICYGASLLLTGSTDAANYEWSTGENTSTIQVAPKDTTMYIFYGYSPQSYCPKTVSDTSIVNVYPYFSVNAGHDTSVVYNQPLLLNAQLSIADSSISYLWTPSTYLSATDAAAVTAVFPYGTLTQTYNVTATSLFGCTSSDQVKVYVYQMLPDILVPSGFTPNSDGKNDVLTPILIGIQKFGYFRIYNRWGQLVFQTTQTGAGWDGRMHGDLQSGGTTFVYDVVGWDYLGRKIEKKGTTVLIL